MKKKRICVFCGSNAGADPVYQSAAGELGALLVEQDRDLVYGGGQVGLMGVIANAVLAGHGRVVGVIPEFLATRELLHAGVSEMHVVPTMHARKSKMEELSDGFVALPGGFGTFDELFEILTWAQLGLHQKPIGLLNVRGFFDPLLALVDRAIETQFVKATQRGLFVVSADAGELLEKMDRYVPVKVKKWITSVKKV